MSETAAAPAPAPIPNYSASAKTLMVDGEPQQVFEVKFGLGPANPTLPAHVMDVRRVDMGDQFDLAEIAGSQVDNDVWLSLAIVALSIQTFDGTPIPRGNVSKASLRTTLKKIGPLGVRAARRAVFEMSGIAADEPSGEQEKKVPTG